jgi:RNase P subunit RPR2
LGVSATKGVIAVVLERIKELHAEIEELKAEMFEVAGEFGRKNVSPELVGWIYWESPYDLKDFAQVMNTSSSALKQLIPPKEIQVKCKSCRKVLIMSAKRHSRVEKILKSSHLCDECTEKKARKAEVKRSKEQVQDSAAKGRATRWGKGLDLENMPYEEYLQTEYWKKFAHNAREKADYSCQECGASNCVLHVHHLTYERRGRERYEDVKVLCRSCHEKVHGRKFSIK